MAAVPFAALAMLEHELLFRKFPLARGIERPLAISNVVRHVSAVTVAAIPYMQGIVALHDRRRAVIVEILALVFAKQLIGERYARRYLRGKRIIGIIGIPHCHVLSVDLA